MEDPEQSDQSSNLYNTHPDCRSYEKEVADLPSSKTLYPGSTPAIEGLVKSHPVQRKSSSEF